MTYTGRRPVESCDQRHRRKLDIITLSMYNLAKTDLDFVPAMKTGKVLAESPGHISDVATKDY